MRIHPYTALAMVEERRRIRRCSSVSIRNSSSSSTSVGHSAIVPLHSSAYFLDDDKDPSHNDSSS
ncbi:hypothetical protein HanXRQr2_Chr15g0683841 [Helianthus annuus]|uniref:Uncharacterized protein n=1 Tax=Helianthus annuus TaxID=4232 RepID=A0A9K3H1H1_HELAN|nr:hypothetical protein HanXRQr2_Chr15g0683841 [Helianthus annuus]